MKNEPIVKIENISKSYTISHRDSYDTIRDKVTELVKKPLQKITRKQNQIVKEKFWALRDINFTIQEGERIGIIGKNGSGKSTLLKILSQITQPDTGRIELNGRVASLLEVGTGFHPELTGRENIFLNGAILGMKQTEIRSKIDEIVAFAEIEKFLDTPVKRYSSGMYVRLAFAVAAHLEPEILIVDEVLAVGDAQFQKKCLEKMQGISSSGKTVIFVSHNMTAIMSLCNRSILLNQGENVFYGDTKEVVDYYLKNSLGLITEQKWTDKDKAPGNSFIRMKSAVIKSANSAKIFELDTKLVMEFEFWNFLVDAEINVSVHVCNSDNQVVFNTFSESMILSVGNVKATCDIPSNLLNDETYSLRLLIVKDRSNVIYDISNILIFSVTDAGSDGGKLPGMVRPKLLWKIEN